MLLTIEQRVTVIASFHQPCQPLIGDDETVLRLKTSNNTIFAPSPHTFVEEFAKKKKKFYEQTLQIMLPNTLSCFILWL